MDLVDGAADIFRALADIVVDPRNLGFPRAVRPDDPRAQPLRVVDQEIHRRPLERNAGTLQPDTKLGEDVVDEAFVARAVGEPVHDLGGSNVWRRVHVLLPEYDGAGYVVCRWRNVNVEAKIAYG